MDYDLIEYRPRWTEEPESWYAAIPEYPRWIAVDTTYVYDVRTGIELRSPMYYTRYRGQDFACGQDVAVETEVHFHVSAVTVYALERLSVDELFPGWYWDPILREACPNDRTPAECLAGVRRRLPTIIKDVSSEGHRT